MPPGRPTFADELAAAVRSLGRPVHRCEFDDFHSAGHKWRSARDEYTPQTYYDHAYDYEAFRRHVLAPLGLGGDRRCRFALFSSYRDEFLPELWTVVEPDAVVIVDGGLLLRPELVESWDLVVWLDIDAETSVARARVRDVAWVGDPDVVERRYRTRNLPMHQVYIQETGGPAGADIVIDSRDPERLRVVRGLGVLVDKTITGRVQ